MARTATSAAADRIRIEDEVWDEAFATRVSSRRSAIHSGPRAMPSEPRPMPAASAPGGEIPRPASSDEQFFRPEAPVGPRVVHIRGRGAERNLHVVPRRPPASSIGVAPDRIAMWAVLLGFVLVAVAVLSTHF